MSNASKSESRRTVLNSYLEDYEIGEIKSGCSQFLIEEKTSTFFNRKETKITFNTIDSCNEWSWVAPELDSINILDLRSEEKYLFSTLLKHNYSSPLIRYFAEQESHTSQFKDPRFPDVLIKRITSKIKTGNKSEIIYRYHMSGGSLIFHRILHLDRDFWRVMLKAELDLSIFNFEELHLCADCSEDLMKYVGHSLLHGHYEAGGNKVYGFYRLNGIQQKGFIGKRSSFYRENKRSEFEPESVYFGNKRTQPVSVLIYDKEKERLKRKHAVSDCKTRIEVRFKLSLMSEQEKNEIRGVLWSYFVPNGNAYRTQIFLEYLDFQVRFTTRFNSNGLKDYAPWWRHQFLQPLYHCSLAPFPTIELPDGRSILDIRLLTAPKPEKSKGGRPKGSLDKKKRKSKVINLKQDKIIDL